MKNILNLRTDELERVKNEKCQQKSENFELKDRIKDLEEQLELDQKTIKSKESQLENIKKSNQKLKESKLNEAKESIDEKLEKLSTNLLAKVTNIINEKLSKVDNQVQDLVSIPDKIDENYKSFKDVLAKNQPRDTTITSIREVIKEDHNEKLIQERERKLRAANIIVHGVKEAEIDTEKETRDTEFVNSLFKKIGVDGNFTSIVRLGKVTDDRIRPIKITLENEELKDSIMKRLPNLKNAEEQDFKKISITDDYTVSERNEIRTWVEKAREKNRKEKSDKYTWKVRGTPKNGMSLVKFIKQ